MDFYRRVLAVCLQIPKGKVATYGQIALLCGKPKNARQVGYALNRRLSGEQLPAHRVVNHQGILTGAPAFDYPLQQRMLLEAEGVEVSGEQRVDLARYGWKNTLDDARRLQEFFEKNQI